jgi:uncharacterized protein YbjT (DUF2867 family)
MKILVTGASGQSGSAVVREFARRQIPVRALVRNRGKALSLGSLRNVEIAVGDMLRPDTLADALQGIERVLLISSADSKMLETQCTFIDAAKRYGVQHIVKFSGKESNLGYDAKRFRFTRMHEEIEAYLEDSGIPWTHLRPSQFMQVYLREAPSIVNKGSLCLPLENVRMSPVDQKDIAKVAFALLTTDGHQSKAYEMTGPEALSMSDIAERISDAVGKEVVYRNISPGERRNALLQAGMPPDLVDALDEQGEERRRCPESLVSLATHEMFGVRPTTFAEFAREHAAVFWAGGPLN